MILGIDPGQSGGIAGIDGDDVTAYKMPETEKDIWLLLAAWHGATAVIENVHSSPQMGVSSSFKFGKNLGGLRMACLAAGIRMVEVAPSKWQREFNLTAKGRKLGQGDTEKKNRNKARAQELFPQLKITHAIADALLLAEYGRRVNV